MAGLQICSCQTPLKTLLIVFHRLPVHNPPPSRRKKKTAWQRLHMICLLPPFSASPPAAINPKTLATGPVCQESWTASLRWGPPSVLPAISPCHPYAKILFILHYRARPSSLWSLSLASWTKLLFIFCSPCWTFLKKQSIKYINILIFLLLFVVRVCLSYWANKLFKGQIWKLIHPFILTQCLAHKMDSERFVHGRQWNQWPTYLD